MTRHRLFQLLTITGVLATFSGCAPENEFKPPPPPQVDVRTPLIEDTTIYLEFPGRTQAFARVEIRARVKGFLKSREFQPGQFVKEGQLLFTIEPEQFEAAVTAAVGNLEKAKADLEIATTNWQKRKDANAKNQAVSDIDVLSAEADKKAAAAAVDIADAALGDAKRDRSYTKITTPTAGRVSRDLIDRGNLVGASDPTLLTNVIQDDPIYFNFEVDERTILPFLRNRPSEERPGINDNRARAPSSEEPASDSKEMDHAALRLTLSDGVTEYPVPGKFDFIDNAVDPESGTVKVRAVFENDDGDLADGLFARIGIPETIENAVLVPRASVQRDLGGSFVLVVGPDNKVVRRIVMPTNYTAGENRIIEAFNEEKQTGLKPDDRIITSNLQRARPGIEVTPSEAGSQDGGAEPEPEQASAEPPEKPAADPAPAEQN